MSGCPFAGGYSQAPAAPANPKVNVEALKSEIRKSLINNKVNACPMAIRVAWHASGTWSKEDNTGGSDGARMRFEPELSDDANAGLGIIRDLLLPIHQKNPEFSLADLWTLAGASAVEFLGGPRVPHVMCRTDEPDGSKAVANGRLPDAAQGAQHLRDVFYRQGFNDQEIVALSGAHTLGRAHKSRSGFDGPWTRSPLRFNNAYFKHLIEEEWVKRDWDGKEQFTDKATKTLMMLPTDIALLHDANFLAWVKKYAEDEKLFFDDFAAAFGKLLANGTDASKGLNMNSCGAGETMDNSAGASADFREYAMHGSLEHVQRAKDAGADVHSVEASSGRNALHKATFWGHTHLMEYLLKTCKVNPNAQDFDGDTALHDAARFGHVGCAEALLANGADKSLKNKEGRDALAVATAQEKDAMAKLLSR